MSTEVLLPLLVCVSAGPVRLLVTRSALADAVAVLVVAFFATRLEGC